MAAEVKRFRGSGGVEWTITVPEPGTMARETHDRRVANGELREIAEESAPVKPAAKKAAAKPVKDDGVRVSE